jgi:NADH dehydrogenase
MKRNFAERLSRMNFNDLDIILVSSTEKPLAVMSDEAQEKSEKYLKDLGVKFISNDE